MKFSEGDQVLARSPSSQEFIKAIVVNARANKYRVQFKGGIEHTLPEADIRAERTSRSQTRSRGRGAGKSPSRNSPSRRSPARRSPARSPNTQSRKIPARSNARQAKITLARLEIPKDNSSDTDRTEGSESLQDEFIEQPTKSRLRDLGPVTRRKSIRIMSNASKAEHEQKLMQLRGNDRAVSLPLERKTQYNAASESKERGFSVQPDEDMLKLKHYDSDTDIEVVSEKKSKEIDLSKPQEWGGWLGALFFIVTLPVLTVLLQLACSNNNCSHKNFRIPSYKKWREFFNLEAFSLHIVFLIFVAIASVVPIGRLIDGQQTKIGRLQYRLNGIWILILSVAIFGGCAYQGYDVSDFLLKKSLPLAIAGLTSGILLSIVLYIKGGRVPVSNLNMYGSTNSFIYNFWQGREVSPRFGPFDVKIILFRFALIGTIIINLAAIVKLIKGAESLDLNNLHVAAILAASLQIIYALDSFIFESSFISTFEITYEGTGYMLSVGYLIYPYLATITTRYLLIDRAQRPIYLQVVSALIFCIGYAIYRKSNSQKDEFRKNPFAPSVSKLETIQTKRGKRLIVSGLWGHVRHPNYLGDILMHWSIAILSFTSNVLPYLLAIQTTVLLIHRAIRDNARCAQRYGYDWQKYCSRVKYMIIKRVF